MMTSKIENKQGQADGLQPSNKPKLKATGNSPLGSKPNSLVLAQRNLGNRNIQTLSDRNIGRPLIQRKCACGGSCAGCSAKPEDERSFVQPKLTVGPANDTYEQEADRVADQIMRMPDVMAQADEEEEELIKPKIQRVSVQSDFGFDPGPDFQLSQGGGQGLSPSTRDFMETRFGTSFGQVRIHNDHAAQQSAAQIRAKAFTSGNHIWLGKGTSGEDKNLMAHELTHVIQQTGSTPREKSRLSLSQGAPSSRIQPARLPCTSIKTVNVYGVNLPGATGDITADVANANPILCQCGITLNVVGSESWQTDLQDRLNPLGVLNEYPSPGNATAEEIEMLAYQPGGDALHIYYAPSLSSGNLAEAFWTSGFPTLSNGVVMSNAAPGWVLPHEIGHVLLDDGSHFTGNNDNLMTSGGSNSGAGELVEEQCQRM